MHATIKATIANNPEIKYSQNGTAYIKINLAQNHYRKNEQTGKYEQTGTTWWQITIWGNNAENAAEMLTKGTYILATGQPHTYEYQDHKTGQTRTSLEIEQPTIGIIPTSKTTNSKSPYQSTEPAWN